MRKVGVLLVLLGALALAQEPRDFTPLTPQLTPAQVLPTALTPTLEAKPPSPFQKGKETLKEEGEKKKAKKEKKGEKKELRPYGLDFFEEAPPAFETPLEGNIPPEYTLASGDKLQLTVYSSVGQQATYALQIDPTGSTYIPMVGRVFVAGLRLDELEGKLLRTLRPRYPQLSLYLSLAALHTVRIFVTGEAKKPGAYLLSGVTTAFNALYMAGGPTEHGSMRNIELLRRGKRVATIDLYRYFLFGEEKFYPLQSGDTLFIPIVGPQVGLEGEVKREALFELTEKEKSLSDLLAMGGGLKPTADVRHIQVGRIVKNRERVLIDLLPHDLKSFSLLPGDMVTVFPVLDRSENLLKIEGKVEKPGSYAYEEGMRVLDLIHKAGGVLKTEPVYMGRADIFRIDPSGNTAMVSFSLREALEGKMNANLLLQPFDRVVIYSPEEALFFDRTVSIQGAVKVPGVYPRTEGMRVLDLIHLAGGLLPEASDEVEIATANSSRIRIRTLSLPHVLAGESDNILLRDRDVVTIKKRGNFLRQAKTVTISGEVKFPGTYALTGEEDTLYQLLERAGGLTKNAFSQGAVFTRLEKNLTSKEQRETVRKITEALNFLLDTQYDVELAQFGVKREKRGVTPLVPSGAVSQSQGLKTVQALQQASEALMGVTPSPEKLVGVGKPRELQPEEQTTRIPIDLQKIISSRGQEENLLLKEGDQLFVPRTPLTVAVVGAVVNPSNILYRPGATFPYYVQQAGGPTEEGNIGKIIVVRANGEVVPRKKVRQIERGDIIIVPSKPILVKKRKSGLEQAQDILQIFTNAATGVLTILALKNLGR